MKFENFIGPTYIGTGDGTLASAEECINWYPELVETAGGRNRYKYRRTPGLQLFCTLLGPLRGIFAGENRLFAVAGNNFYEIFSSGSFNLRGTVANDGFPVDMAFNGNQVAIASGGQIYCDNGAGPVAATFVGGGNVPGVRVSYLDGYFWAQKGASAQNTNSNQFFLSALQDGTTWDPLQFASKSAFPDNIAAIYTDHEEMWIFGDEQSTEVWANNGQVQPQFPFQRNPAAILNLGCRAPFSVSRLGNGVAWLAGDQQRGGVFVVHCEGYRPRRISTHPIEAQLRTLALPATNGNWIINAIAYTEIRDGHEFYVIAIPSFGAVGGAIAAQPAWAYDLTTQLWHKRAFWNGTTNIQPLVAFQAWVNLGFSGSAYYGGGPNNGNIYIVDQGYLTDAGTQIVRQRQAPYVADSIFSVIHHRLRILMQTGFSGAALIPSLTWSDDGGQTYSNALTQTIPSGQFMAPVEWGGAASGTGGLGVSPRGRIYNLLINNPVDVELIDASIEVSPGRY